MKHETRIRQAPGWWPTLIEAICTCGWRGPTRDDSDANRRGLRQAERDEYLHLHPEVVE